MHCRYFELPTQSSHSKTVGNQEKAATLPPRNVSGNCSDRKAFPLETVDTLQWLLSRKPCLGDHLIPNELALLHWSYLVTGLLFLVRVLNVIYILKKFMSEQKSGDFKHFLWLITGECWLEGPLKILPGAPTDGNHHWTFSPTTATECPVSFLIWPMLEYIHGSF